MQKILHWFAISLIVLASEAYGSDRPNIVWINVEDMSSHFGYQGETLVETPNVDRLAREGVVFSNAYVTAPVCSTSRSALITGMYQTTLGVHNHRGSRGKLKIELPADVPTIPELMKRAGYFTCNLKFDGSHPESFDTRGKEDYNFVIDRPALYESADWTARSAGQPFFAQVHLHGGKLREHDHWRERVTQQFGETVDPSAVTLPPYYPDHPMFREDWARYLDTVRYTDFEVGLLLERLRNDGVLNNTVIVFMTDHGISQARGKQFLYDEGAKIPLIVWAPGRGFEASKREELVAHIDIAATTLDLAGIGLPKRMQGRPLFGEQAEPRERVFIARDRCDETVDRIRGVREGRFKYLRNYYPRRPYLQPCAYKDNKPFMIKLRELAAAGELDEVQSLHLAETRPEEELYDLEADPFEVHNLIGAPEHADRVAAFRQALADWEVRTNDQGRQPESVELYDSDMQAYLNSRACKTNPAYAKEVRDNIALMKRWQAEGR